MIIRITDKQKHGNVVGKKRCKAKKENACTGRRKKDEKNVVEDALITKESHSLVNLAMRPGVKISFMNWQKKKSEQVKKKKNERKKTIFFLSFMSTLEQSC